MTARRIGILAAVIALLAAGTYLFVYLYRWEWHRAIVAGIIFLAAEVGLGVVAILDRLRRIERRLDSTASAADLDRVLRHIQDAAPDASKPFAWLRPDSNQLHVFVPILLGAGVVLSGIAWVVERVARATAGPVLERGLAMRLAPLSIPEGALTGAPVTFEAPGPGAVRRHLVRGIAALFVGAVALSLSVDRLADLTQDRPDVVPRQSVSVVTLDVESQAHYNDGGDVAVAQAVWSACTSQVRRHGVPAMSDLGGGQVQAVVRPAIGPNAQARLRGCLEDATVDRLQIHVTSVRNVASE